jgi:hypothetical protein
MRKTAEQRAKEQDQEMVNQLCAEIEASAPERQVEIVREMVKWWRADFYKSQEYQKKYKYWRGLCNKMTRLCNTDLTEIKRLQAKIKGLEDHIGSLVRQN